MSGRIRPHTRCRERCMPANICQSRVIEPVALNSTPCTRCSPSSTCGGSPGLTPAVRRIGLVHAEERAAQQQFSPEKVPFHAQARSCRFSPDRSPCWRCRKKAPRARDLPMCRSSRRMLPFSVGLKIKRSPPARDPVYTADVRQACRCRGNAADAEIVVAQTADKIDVFIDIDRVEDIACVGLTRHVALVRARCDHSRCRYRAGSDLAAWSANSAPSATRAGSVHSSRWFRKPTNA